MLPMVTSPAPCRRWPWGALLLSLFALLQLLQPISLAGAQTTAVKIGFIVDNNRPLSLVANTSILLALSDFYRENPNYTTRIHIVERNSDGDIVSAASAALDLIQNEGVQAIIGPMTSAECDFVDDIGAKAQVPIISISTTSPAVSPAYSPYFIRAAGNDKNQVNAIAALVKAYGWRRVVTVLQDDEYGAAFLPYLVDALGDVGIMVPYKSALPATASDDLVLAELYRLETMQTRVFVVHTRSVLATQIFRLAEEAGMMGEGHVWILTARLAGMLGWIDPSADTLQGVLGVEFYSPPTRELQDFEKRWAAYFLRQHPAVDHRAVQLGNYGVWAHDAARALAIAVERLGPAAAISNANITSSGGFSELANLKASATGAILRDLILKTQFDGLGGRFRLDDGELNVTAVSIINVIGQGKKEIGYWTPANGLVRNVKPSKSTKTGSKSNGNLGPVIWPGETTVLPKGWEQPTNDVTLRIAVPGPVSPGFWPFLRTEINHDTNLTTATGFVIDVFEAAVRRLPYALVFEYVRVTNVSYDALTSFVSNGTYDAAVADITITENRSKNVDFTLPYKSSGVSMTVRLMDQNGGKMWVFLKPLRTDLWLSSMAFFVIIGFVVWALERRRNEEFREGPVHRQIGTIFYFGFSTLVFAHRENVLRNYTRFVVIVWLFTVLILQSSYTASLTSMLTVQRQKPKVVDFNELLNSGGKIGFLRNSFVKNFLQRMNIPDSKLMPLRSPESFRQALDNASVVAIVDETPYLQLFLNLYCDNYTIIGPTNKTGGFGFAFPRGSPLVEDLSRAILNLTEGDELNTIERKWFGDSATCASRSNALSSNQIGVESFLGLFLITGVTSLLCFFIHLVTFVIQNRRSIRNITTDDDPSVVRKLASVARLFDEKDPSFHTFKSSDDATAAALPSTTDNTPPNLSNNTSGYSSPAVNLLELATSTELRPNLRSTSQR